MSNEVMAIANSWQLWALCGLVVLLVMIQNGLFLRLCRKEAVRIGYPLKNLNRAVGNGMITAIGPCLAGVVVMISMMALVGNPFTWYRLSIIGAAQTELTVANLGSDAMGVKLGTPEFGIMAFTFAAFLWAFNGNGWIFFTTILTGSMEKIRYKLAGGDMTWLNLLSTGCVLGVFTYLTSAQIIRIVPIGTAKSNPGPFAAAIGAYLIQYSLDRWVAPKAKWIRSYAMTLALIGGLILAYIVRPV